MVALVGAIGAILSRERGVFMIVLPLLSLIVLMSIAYAYDLRANGDRGITSEIAMLLTFLLGTLALSDDLIVPLTRKLIVISALGIGMTTILSFKEPLHGFVAKISRDDIYATLKFLIVSVIVLPLLPNESVGPFGAFNPFVIGTMAALIAGIGFLGYVAMRVLGQGRGLGITGMIGGLVSSTAVTLSMAERAKKDEHGAPGYALAAALASTVMLVRILVVVAVTNRELLSAVLWPVAAMTLGSIAGSSFLYLRASKQAGTRGEVRLTNPFELSSALKFAGLFALVLFASKMATHYFGERGSYLAGAISGTTDVDAITLSMARQVGECLNTRVAATTILIAAVSNTIVKAGLATILGGWSFGKRVAFVFVLALLSGVAGVAFLWAT